MNNFPRALSPDPTDYPWVSEDGYDEDAADLLDNLYRLDAWQQKWKIEFNPYHTVFFSVLKLT